jgi:signal transduction histidine kinase
MVTTAPAAKRPLTDSSRHAVAAIAAASLAVTVVIASAGWAPAYQNRAVHLAKETVAALVLLLVAGLLAGRVSRRGTLLDLLALAGVLVLATKNLVFSVLTGILAESSGGLTTWRTTGAGLIGAALLAIAALAPRRVVRDRRRAILVAAVGALAAFVLLSVVASLLDFPGALTEPPDTRAELRLLSQHPALVVADVGATVLFLVAGLVFARRAEREADELHLWLAIGATIAAVGYLNYALYPSSYTDFLYAGDLFRLAAVVALGIGTIRELSRYQRVYASAVVLDERRRVARDLHDGVAQELAFIASRLQGPQDPETATEVREAVGRALDESRRAIATLSRPLEEPLHLALANTARAAVGLSGARLELDLQEGVVVPAAWEDALQRVAREAVTTAVQAGAPAVTVRLRDADGIRLVVAGDGVAAGSARERVESLGGAVTARAGAVEVLLR